VSIERQAVRNDVVEPNLALLYPCEAFVDVFLRGRLTESQRDSLVEDLPSGKLS
jgi:hypothetical protein